MSESELCFLTAWEMARLVRAREVSPAELVQSHLDRIAELNPNLVAFVHLDATGALNAAKSLGSDSSNRPLAGVPVAYKDIYDVAGMPTTAGSRIMSGYVPSIDCTVARRMRQAGAVCLGKLNTFEFASGSMELFGDARNPWNLACSPGGSALDPEQPWPRAWFLSLRAAIPAAPSGFPRHSADSLVCGQPPVSFRSMESSR